MWTGLVQINWFSCDLWSPGEVGSVWLHRAEASAHKLAVNSVPAAWSVSRAFCDVCLLLPG